jgi:hypothetical protein
MTETEIVAATAEPFNPGRAELTTPGGPPDAVALCIRVPEALDSWIYDEAMRWRISPSLLAAELLGEAIAARQQP